MVKIYKKNHQKQKIKLHCDVEKSIWFASFSILNERLFDKLSYVTDLAMSALYGVLIYNNTPDSQATRDFWSTQLTKTALSQLSLETRKE